MNTGLKTISACNNCKLHRNQSPLLDSKSRGGVFWVGLSAVKVSNVESEIPLSPHTKSGKLIEEIETPFSDLNFYKTNLVKCLPLKDGKIRYPTKSEMFDCVSNFSLELHTLKPQLVFLLGQQVASFIARWANQCEVVKFHNDFNYMSFYINNTLCVPVHHPSFVLIYRRKTVDEYVMQIRNFISSLNGGECRPTLVPGDAGAMPRTAYDLVNVKGIG